MIICIILGIIWGFLKIMLFYDGENYSANQNIRTPIFLEIVAVVFGIMWGIKGDEDEK